MKIIKQSVELIEIIPISEFQMLRMFEEIGRTCYKSEHKITDTSAPGFVKTIMKANHQSILEHVSLSFRIITDRSTTHELVRHRLASYCLAGDTIVKSFNNNKKWSIEQLYNWQSDIKRKGRLKLIQLKSVDKDNIIKPNSIKNIIKSGLKDVYLVKTQSGRSIKTTLEHRYLTKNGYKKLKELKVGDSIYANGLDALDNKEYLEKRYLKDNLTRKDLAKEVGCCETILYRAFVKFNIKKPLSDRPNRVAGYGKKGMFSKEHIDNLSKRMTGCLNHRWKSKDISMSGSDNRIRKNHIKTACSVCGTNKNIETHHLDKNCINNADSNLKDLCSTCHKAFHGKNIKAVFSDEIISIDYFGEVMTYDIEMLEDPHNFVANGLVVHNSQESQRYVKYGDVEFIEVVPELVGEAMVSWVCGCIESERYYKNLIKAGEKPQIARSVLNNSAKTEIVMTANIREWKYVVLPLRTSPKAHPQIRDIMYKIKAILEEKYPTIFKESGVNEEN